MRDVAYIIQRCYPAQSIAFLKRIPYLTSTRFPDLPLREDIYVVLRFLFSFHGLLLGLGGKLGSPFLS